MQCASIDDCPILRERPESNGGPFAFIRKIKPDEEYDAPSV
jgi:hypothetical protein